MNTDGRVMNFLSRLGDMFILNVLYLISCIPVVTIGAATTALYYNTLKMAENRESYVWREYWKAFRQNFKQATIVWMILLACIFILGSDVLLLGGMSKALGSVVALIVIVLGIFLIMMGVYVFPVLARFDNTVKNTFKNALIMAVRHLPSTIVIVILHGLPLLPAMVSIQVFLKGALVVLLFTVSILAYFQSKLFTRIFSNYYPKDKEYDFARYSKGGVISCLNKRK
ncbi:MAG: YesL family protein [Dorea sp.]|jgi:uncharacterized membrane protein YesL|nr:YesL family protein [Dorea sp.]